MKTERRFSGNLIIVKPLEDIRVKNILALKNDLELVLEKDSILNAAIDLSMVAFIDSSGIGLLANFAKRIYAKGGKACLFNYNDDIRQLLDITGIEQAMPLYDDEEQMKRGMFENGQKTI